MCVLGMLGQPRGSEYFVFFVSCSLFSYYLLSTAIENVDDKSCSLTDMYWSSCIGHGTRQNARYGQDRDNAGEASDEGKTNEDDTDVS